MTTVRATTAMAAFAICALALAGCIEAPEPRARIEAEAPGRGGSRARTEQAARDAQPDSAGVIASTIAGLEDALQPYAQLSERARLIHERCIEVSINVANELCRRSPFLLTGDGREVECHHNMRFGDTDSIAEAAESTGGWEASCWEVKVRNTELLWSNYKAQRDGSPSAKQ